MKLREVIENEDTEKLRLMVAAAPKGALEQPFQSLTTPLHWAVSHDFKKGAEALLDAGVDPNVRHRKRGLTPLHYAVRNRRRDLIPLLLKYHANPNVQDAEGSTPLHFATEWADLDLMILLTDHRANPAIEDETGTSPDDMAKRKGWGSVADFVKKYRKREPKKRVKSTQ